MNMFCCVLLDPEAPANPEALMRVARACSPRVDAYAAHGDRCVVFDVSGLDRVVGPPRMVAAEVHRLAVAEHISARVAIAAAMTAAVALAHAHPGVTVVDRGGETAALHDLPLELSQFGSEEPLLVLRRWGIRTFGQLAQLSEADIRARLGPAGVLLHRGSRGRDSAPLVPVTAAPKFIERLELEWPIDGLEALAFVLGRLCDALSAALERADRGAVDLTTRLRLVTRTTHERTLHLPAAMRDARVLRTLILLDLESHPPDAAIDIVEIELQVAPGRILQGSLFRRSLPAAEHLATLIARLSALMGDTRVGRPQLIDTYDERAIAMQEFGRNLPAQTEDVRMPAPCVKSDIVNPVLRRFRIPIPADVTVSRGAPVHVRPCARGLPAGAVVERGGPWRSSGRWWSSDGTQWDRDAWHVEVGDVVYRLMRDRLNGRWELEGVVD